MKPAELRGYGRALVDVGEALMRAARGGSFPLDEADDGAAEELADLADAIGDDWQSAPGIVDLRAERSKAIARYGNTEYPAEIGPDAPPAPPTEPAPPDMPEGG